MPCFLDSRKTENISSTPRVRWSSERWQFYGHHEVSQCLALESALTNEAGPTAAFSLFRSRAAEVWWGNITLATIP
jgi:hypothetical protein